jgi:hypothetical protein
MNAGDDISSVQSALHNEGNSHMDFQYCLTSQVASWLVLLFKIKLAITLPFKKWSKTSQKKDNNIAHHSDSREK